MRASQLWFRVPRPDLGINYLVSLAESMRHFSCRPSSLSSLSWRHASRRSRGGGDRIETHAARYNLPRAAGSLARFEVVQVKSIRVQAERVVLLAYSGPNRGRAEGAHGRR